MEGETKIAVLFPGQGSQYVGMGKEFVQQRPAAGDLFSRAEQTSGLPLKRYCLEGPMSELTRTLHLQPAVTAVNMMVWDAVKESGLQVDCVAGHSLGEYSALYASGVLRGEDTLRLVTERGRLMEREAERNPGGMHAVLGLTLDKVGQVLAELDDDRVVAANYNSEKQIVLSGEAAGLSRAAEKVAAAGGKAIALKVSGAWHSPLVAGAVDDFLTVMQEVVFHPPRIPVFFNVTGELEDDPQAIRRIMARQIASMVRWVDILHAMMGRGVSVFIEAGPKNVLSGLLKKILPNDYPYRSFQVDTPEKLTACLDVLLPNR
jgi:[acyl-carrier-protein] S-malonyltransferase